MKSEKCSKTPLMTAFRHTEPMTRDYSTNGGFAEVNAACGRTAFRLA